MEYFQYTLVMLENRSRRRKYELTDPWLIEETTRSANDNVRSFNDTVLCVSLCGTTAH